MTRDDVIVTLFSELLKNTPLPWLLKFSESMLKLEVVLLLYQLGYSSWLLEFENQILSFWLPLSKAPKTAQPVADDGNHEELARRAARWEKEGEYVQVGCPLKLSELL